jgi:hypothetical protein
MKQIIMIGLIICSFLNSCTKQRQIPVAVLSFRFDNRDYDVEWHELTGSRYANSSNFFITANGFDFQQFHLELENIKSIGLVSNVTSKNISYLNHYGFKTGNLQSVEIRIIDINVGRIYGRFEAAFINSYNSADVIKAKGEFSIAGQE